MVPSLMPARYEEASEVSDGKMMLLFVNGSRVLLAIDIGRGCKRSKVFAPSMCGACCRWWLVFGIDHTAPLLVTFNLI